MKTSLLLFPLGALAACSDIPQDAYFNRGTPESLLDMSSEVVSVNTATTDELAGWINREPPTRAELFCVDADPACGRAKDALRQFNIAFKQTPDPQNKAMLYYEHVMARDCENRYIDNSINPYNLNHPTFGCSIAVNMVQAVTDKRQFVNPALMDFPDAEKASQMYRNYISPAKADSNQDDSPLVQGGGGSGLK